MTRTGLTPGWRGRRRGHGSRSFPRPNQQDLTGCVVDDEAGFLTQAFGTQVGLIPVPGHNEEIRVDGRGGHLVARPPVGPDSAARTAEALSGRGQQVISRGVDY